MSEIQFKEVECYVCNDKIRVVFVNDIGTYYCGKLKCKLMVFTLRKEDWRPYVQMKDWGKARKIIEEMNT